MWLEQSMSAQLAGLIGADGAKETSEHLYMQVVGHAL
jgi:hypothetical protein